MHYGNLLPLRCLAWLGVLCFATTLAAKEPAAVAEQEFPPEQVEFFEKEVRPLLIKRCYECHSSDSKELGGGLRVDSRTALLAGGDTGAAAVPGNAKESLMIDAINYGDIYQMPPKSKLPAAEIALLTRWVEMGAPWPPGDQTEAAQREEFDLQHRRNGHWAWQPIGSPGLPEVKNATWPRDDLDRFILTRLEAKGWRGAVEADRRTLIRRLYFALIGLPPEPAAVEAFLHDDSPQAYEAVVDRLLESPQFGERWARHWLDLVRYAESRGHEFDFDAPNAYQYRDYVIRALNADVPYDQFVREHIAGDLLKAPRTRPGTHVNESILGTGFWFLGEWVHSPVDTRQDEADRLDNMLDVFSKTFLGMTVACARCHDHKFDAISQADYYALAGFLQSSTYRQARFESMLPNQQLNRELEEIRAKHRAAVAQAAAQQLRPAADKLDAYLMAARSVIGEIVEAQRLPANAESRAALLSDFAAQIKQQAEQQGLEPQVLRGWVDHLLDASLRDTSPVAPWFRLAQKSEGGDVSEMLTHLESFRKPTLPEILAEANVVVDYATASPHEFLSDGPQLGTGPLAAGTLMLNGEAAEVPVALSQHGAARRDPFWHGLQLAPGTQNDPGRTGGWVRAGSTLATPTFSLEASHVYFLVRGAANGYAEVDSHRVNQGPLHGSLIKRFDTKGELQWVSQNLDRYRGHRLHVEFSTEKEAPLEILAVVQADRAPPLPQSNAASSMATRLKSLETAEPASLASEVKRAFLQAVEGLAANAVQDPLQRELVTWMLNHPGLFGVDVAAEGNALAAAIAAWRQAEAERLPRRVLVSHTAPAMWEGTSVNEHLFIRGNHKTLGEVVPRATLTALQGNQPVDYGPGSGRLLLAQQLTSPENPLVARVMVNRVWHHLFGHGLVRSVDNFGVLGEEPSHRELLDFLAARFMQEGWSVKRLIRAIVLSSTYRMDSTAADAQALAADPQNRLLYRQNIRRLEGEVIRDALLALSGRYDPKMFGPSVPIHLTGFLQGRGRPASGPLDGQGRRSIYLSVRRNFLSPMMLAFDTPIPFTTVGRRNVSNVPAQALILLNDPLVAEQADRWARRVFEAEGDTTARVQLLYKQAYAREASERELAAATAFLASQGAEYGLNAEQAANDPRVWADLCHVLINAKEFVFIR